MTLERVRELMTIEKECVKRGNTCGRNCATCELVQKDEDLLAAYDIVQIALTIMEGFNDILEDVDELFHKQKEEEPCMADGKT